MTYTTEGIIISYYKYREYDRIYTVYTKDFGKIHLLARGSNKITSKLAGHMEPAVLSSLMIARGKTFAVLAQARVIQSFSDVRQNSHKFALASVLLESVDKLTAVYQEDSALFDLLRVGLNRIASIAYPERDGIHFVYHYLLHLLILSGYAHDVFDEEILKPLLVANIDSDDIIVDNDAKQCIVEYQKKAMSENKLYSLELLNGY